MSKKSTIRPVSVQQNQYEPGEHPDPAYLMPDEPEQTETKSYTAPIIIDEDSAIKRPVTIKEFANHISKLNAANLHDLKQGLSAYAREKERLACSCGMICHSCSGSFLEQTLKRFREGDINIEGIELEIIKKVGLVELKQNERDTIEAILNHIIDSDRRIGNVKANFAKNPSELKKHTLQLNRSKTEQKKNFKELMANIKDRAFMEHKVEASKFASNLQNRIEIFKQKIALLEYEAKHAISLTVKYHDLYQMANVTIKEISERKIKVSQANQISEYSYSEPSPSFPSSLQLLKNYTKKEIARKVAFEEQMRSRNETEEVIKQEREKFQQQLKAERKRFEEQIRKEREAAIERETRQRFLKIEAEQTFKLRENELQRQIINLQKILIEKNLATNQLLENHCEIDLAAHPVGLPLEAQVDMTTYGVRVYVCDKYSDYVWRNGKWYKKAKKIEFDNFKQNDAMRNNQITDDFHEYVDRVGRIFYIKSAYGHIIFDPLTNTFNEGKGCNFD